MDGKAVKTGAKCNTRKYIENFYENYSELKACNFRKVLKPYYINKDKIFQQSRKENARFKDLDSRSKALEEKL